MNPRSAGLSALCLALTAAWMVGCEGQDAATPAAPVPPMVPATPPSPPVAATAEFVEESIRIVEGETVEIVVRYEVRELAAAVRLAVVVAETGAEAADYEFGTESIEIPAGQGTSGEASGELRASVDLRIAEGDESLALRLVAPEGPRVDLGPELGVTIEEGGGSPCPGVTVLAEPPQPLPEGPPWTTVPILGTTFRMDLLPEAAEITFDWVGPYRETPKQDDGFSPRWTGNRWHSMPEFAVAHWRTERAGAALRHWIRMEWPADTDLDLAFFSWAGGCEGQPLVTCDGSGCGLSR